jgi:dihydroanticapsin dehydrogenase
MNLGLEARSIVVAGGASGIGAACVEVLAAEGATVTVLDRRLPEASVRGAARCLKVDITDEPALGGIFADTSQRIDGLVNCAGISGPVGTLAYEIGADDWDRVMAINAKGSFLLAKHLRPCMPAGAAIVLLASDSSLVAAPGMAAYCASKAAILMLGRSLSVDLAPDRIRVNCICPSIVDTPMSRADLGRPDGFADFELPVISATEIARHVAYLISPLAASVNGTQLVVDHGYLARSAFPA